MTLIKVPLSSAIIDTFLPLLEIKIKNPDRIEFIIKRHNIKNQIVVTENEVVILSHYISKLIKENQRLIKNQRQLMENENTRLETIKDTLIG